MLHQATGNGNPEAALRHEARRATQRELKMMQGLSIPYPMDVLREYREQAELYARGIPQPVELDGESECTSECIAEFDPATMHIVGRRCDPSLKMGSCRRWRDTRVVDRHKRVCPLCDAECGRHASNCPHCGHDLASMGSSSLHLNREMKQLHGLAASVAGFSSKRQE